MDATAPVSNETAVATAKNALEAVLDDPKSTAEEISDAVKALTDATTAEKENRDTANTTANPANEAATSAANSDQSQSQAVQDAITALQQAQADAANDEGTSEAIATATKQLQDAVAQEAANQATELQAAELADQVKGQTAPVSQEPGVQQAVSDLDTLLNDSTATAAQINDAIKALQDAVAEANDERDAVNQASATDAITSAQGSDLSADQGVQDAIKALEDVMNQADADSPDALTSDIQDAMKALQDAQLAAVESRNSDEASALVQDNSQTSPVTNEPAITDAKSALQDVIDDPNATAADLEDAKAAYQDVIDQTKTQRDNTKAAAQSSTVATDESVLTAIQNLKDAQTKAANETVDDAGHAWVSQDIVDAMRALQEAVSVAEQAQDTAKNALSQTKPVSNESATAKAISDLQALLADENSTAEAVRDATKALTAATASDTTERNATNTEAADAILSNAQGTPQINEPAVQEAVEKLQELQKNAANDSSSALTQDILDAIQELSDTVAEAARDKQEAVLAAYAAGQVETAPVSNESGVKDAQSALDKVLNDPSATVEEINDATTALENAVDTANAARDSANSNADTAHSVIDDAQTGDQAGEPGVQDAIAKLQDLQTKAAADNADALTADIEAATKAVTQAIADAKAAQDAARPARDAAGQVETAPVSNEQGVQDAQQALNNVLDDPASTVAEIEAAQQALEDAVKTAQDNRDAANSAAQAADQAVTAAEATNQADEQSVQDAIQALRDLQDAASQDDENALTADIEAATKAIADAVEQAAAAQDPIDDAEAVVTSPVSHETEVVNAQKALDDLIASAESGGDVSIADINDAAQALQEAVDAASEQRDTANHDEATTAVTNAQNSDYADEQGVQDAIAALKEAQDNAAKDTGTTAEITDAMTALQDALDAAKSDQQKCEDAVTAAQDAMSDTAPVSLEPDTATAKETLQKVLDDPKATATDIEEAMQDFKEAIDTVREERTAVDAAITNAQAGDNANNEGVQAAIENLQNVIANATDEKSDSDGNVPLTDDIEAAKQALAQAISDAASARAAAAAAIAAMTPVSNEANILAASKSLQDILDNQNATADQITNATTALTNATATEKDTRSDAVSAADGADTAISNASQSTAALDSDVIAAQKALQEAVDNANADTGTTDAVTKATEALNKAISDAQADQEAAYRAVAVASAKAVATNPVSQETAVASAKDNLDKVLADSASTTDQIIAARDALKDAVADALEARNNALHAIVAAKSDRETAKTNAETAETNATDQGVAGDSTVVAAQKALDDAVAAADNNTGTTQAIVDATNALRTYTVTLTATDATGLKTTKTITVVVTETSPYDQESAVSSAASNLETISNDPTKTTADVQAAQKALDQVFTVNYTDTQAPTISTGKDSYQVTTGAGATADSFLKAINAQATDNQMDGSTTLASNYADVVKDEPADVESVTGGTDSKIAFTATDSTLAKTGYTYNVTGADGKTYDTLSAALAATPNYDNTSNDGDTDATATPSGYRLDSASTTLASGISMTYATTMRSATITGKFDADTATDQNSTIVLKADKQTATLKQVVNAKTRSNGVYDSTTNSSGASDAAVQSFGVSYSALSQKANFTYSGGTPLSGAPTVTSGVTDDALPGSLFVYPQQATVNRTGLNAANAVKNGTTVAASGVTSGAIAIADASLAVAGYSYVVTAPDGKQYSTMSEALAAVLTSTKLDVGDGQSVGINGASPKASSDTFSYDAPVVPGYYIKSANDISVKVGSGTTPSLDLVYEKSTLTFSLGGKVTKSMTINTTTMPYLSFALIGSAGDNTTEMTSSIQSVSGTKASMTVPVTYKDTAGNTYKDASGTYPMVGIRTTDSSGNLTQASVDSSLTSGSGVSSLPASNKPDGINAGTGAAWSVKYTASTKTKNDFTASGSFYVGNYAANAADYNGILLSSILPDTLGSGTGGGGLGIQGIKNAISFGMDMYSNGSTFANTTIDKATAVPSRSTTSTGKETSDYLVKGSAKYQDTNSNNNYSWYSLSNGKQQTGLVVYNTALDQYDDEVPLFKAGSEGTQKKWLVKGIATLAMLGGIAAASDASGVADKVDDMFEAAIHMALEPASAAT
ncbi:hypothetical protein H7R52_12005 [Weissella confusa]|uniref:Gram-positive cocci surface proteins LPxTG domain-containing protein n=1 Tax=Weissella confusa TaxID=1583 RepID=A0A923SNN3_WEICO|nr:hypothetical protein [Weissella confusa]